VEAKLRLQKPQRSITKTIFAAEWS